jgi:small-conductance mechanosensitive channel
MAVGVSALEARDLLGPLSQNLVTAFSGIVILMTFVTSLGRALLANARPSWRLPPIPDATAQRLRAFPLWTALAICIVWLPHQLGLMANTSPSWVAATDAFGAAVMSALIAAMLVRLRGPHPNGADTVQRTAAPSEADAAPPERPLWVALLLGAISVVLIAIWLFLALGYVALANATAGQMAWTGIVVTAFYVLFKFADDLCMGLLSARSGFGQRLQQSFGFAPATLNQAAVVLSAVARLALFFYMLIALLEPLGTEPARVVQRSGEFSDGVKIGEFQLVPAAIFTAIGVLVGGFIALRVARHWLHERYLPTTTMEPGMQSSITTLLGYAGGILVVALALSALGIGINRIAWIASALSVGIGFGLQAIVQNFISGLILLAERPVKVGDWVVLGTTEGDVRRINVRATEIALGDRSTVIVPNSEFITKTVRNMTLSNTEGRVLIRLPMPLDTDAQRVRALILEACAAHPIVLKTPPPSLTLEGIENGQLIFQAIAYVPGPRLAGGVKSDLLFTILGSLRQAGLPLSTPAMVMTTPSNPAPAAEA